MIELEFSVKVYAVETDGMTPNSLDRAFEHGGAAKVRDAIRGAFSPPVQVEISETVVRRVGERHGL